MATTKVTPIQFLRSILNNKRPDPTLLLSGQPAVNLNASQPGLFFADSTGSSLFKVGPCAVGITAPNDGATGPGSGNTLGELWLDLGSTPSNPGPTLKVWDGVKWTNCLPYTYANVLISDSAPLVTDHIPGTLWWNSSTGLMYILYNDGITTQWAQIGSGTVS